MTGKPQSGRAPATGMRRRGSGGRRSMPSSDVALVLRRFRYGESSLIVHLLTPRFGRVVVLAKGAYRPTSGYCGVLDLFDELEVSWQSSRSSEIAVLRSASVRSRRRGITRDLDRYGAACACVELAGMGSRDAQADPQLFQHVSRCLELLHEGAVAPTLLGIAFDLGFLRCMGLEPALERCAACGRDLAGERRRTAPFSFGAGGRLCDGCAAEARHSGRRVEELPRPVLRVARSVLESPLEALSRVHLDGDLTRDLERFVRRFVEYHLESRPRARASQALPRPRLARGGPNTSSTTAEPRT